MGLLLSWGTFLILLLFSCSHLGICFTLVAGQCLQDQKELLLELRNNLTYNSSLSTKLVQWDESIDCCQWGGVKCDAKGRVSGLDLSGESISSGINDASSSLFRLVFLQSLNLAQNSLDSVEFPSGFGKLKELNYLNLSRSQFSGQIPPDLSNLTRLVVLDVSCYLSVRLENPDLKGLVQKLTRLKELYLDGVNVSARGYNWCTALSSSLPNLRVLSLSDSYLNGPFNSSLLQLQSLSVIRLDGNTFSSPFPGFLADFPKLQVLSLSSCNFSGVVPARLFLIKSLQTIDLSYNENLEGSLPDEFPLDGSLQSLVLSSTKFSGKVSESIGNLRMLSTIDLRWSNFSGPIRRLSKNVSASPLRYLDLSANKFEGPIPQFLFELQNLSTLDLSSNKFYGSVELTDFPKQTGLSYLDLSRNNLSVHIDEKVSLSSFLPRLEALKLASCKLQKFPLLENHSSLWFLDLSDNQLQGEIPNYIWKLSNGLEDLNLSHNQFTHLQEPYAFGRYIDFLDLHSNMLHGQIPILPPAATFIDLSNNNFSSYLPTNFARNRAVLDLKRNNLGGEIPDTFPINCWLNYLDLSYNVFQGKVPRSLERCTELEVLSLGNNNLSDTFPCWLENRTSLQVLELRSNKFHGNISFLRENNRWEQLQIIDLASNNFSGVLPTNFFPKLEALTIVDEDTIPLQLEYGSVTASTIGHYQVSVTSTFKGQEFELPKSVLAQFSSIDLSNNHFEGIIPETIGELKGLYVLNFSHNALSGHIPASMGNLRRIGLLDLSSNNLGGKIPSQLTSLTLLSDLNLSYNKLVGRIPQEGQMLTFPDGYVGNEGLCGLPLSKTCSDDSHAPASPRALKSEEERESQDDGGLYASAALGFFVGLAILFWPLALSGRWKRCYNRNLNKFILWVLRR